MKKTLFFLNLFLLIGVSTIAQEAGLEKNVSLNYQNIQLGNALDDISHDYNVFFSYSKDFIPVGERVTVSVYNQPLSKALDELLAPTKVVYAPIGDQIVLKVNDNKPILKKKEEELIGSVDEMPLSSTGIEVYSAASKPELELETPRRNMPIQPTPLMRTPGLEQMDWTDDMLVIHEDALVLFPYEAPVVTNKERIAQLSVLPDVGTNFRKSDEITNNVSVNVLWGKNGGVDGVEIGGLVNTIEGDVNGVQVAGLVNKVKGDLGGTNLKSKAKKSRKTGLQVAGLSNVAASAKGVQIAGLHNKISDGDLKGTQIAGLGNNVAGDAEGWQIAGLFNDNQGNAGLQIAGLFNNADKVSKGQVAGLLNIARKVEGFQIGFINVADSVCGTSFGLFNFIKYGFNRLEISRSETFNLSLGVKFGTPSFYNMLEISSPEFNGERSAFNSTPHWAIGYGIGTSILHKKRLSFQLEVMISHLNEGEIWTHKLNLLNQARLIGTLRLAKHFHFYGGPTINLFVSNLYNQDTQLFESKILREQTLLDQITLGAKPQRVQVWLGYKAGIRF